MGFDRPQEIAGAFNDLAGDGCGQLREISRPVLVGDEAQHHRLPARLAAQKAMQMFHQAHWYKRRIQIGVHGWFSSETPGLTSKAAGTGAAFPGGNAPDRAAPSS